MSLITKTVKVKWNSRIKKHYVDLGYEYTKMGDEFEVKVEDLTKGSRMEVKCVCDGCGCELNWKYQNYNRCVKDNGKTYCQKCSRICSNDKRNNTLLKSSKSFKEWCIENDKQDVLNRWDYELNNCLPSEISYGTHKKYWFKCDKHIKHKSELKNIKSFTSGHNGVMDCKQCNSIAQWFLNNNLKLENYWDYNKNTLDPWEISYSSDKKVWIKCQEKDYHESYEIACSDFIDGCRCPYCNHNSGKIHPKDSLGQYIIDNYNEDVLNKIWSKKNKKSPFEYTPYSNYKVWWKCLNGKHEDYKRGCYSSLKYNFRCPQCSKERTESFGEEKTRLYLESLGYNILHEHNCTIRPINPKTKMPLHMIMKSY